MGGRFPPNISGQGSSFPPDIALGAVFRQRTHGCPAFLTAQFAAHTCSGFESAVFRSVRSAQSCPEHAGGGRGPEMFGGKRLPQAPHLDTLPSQIFERGFPL